MKIIELRAQNVKRLQAVTITPNGNVVQITGENGAGKTSVLDAIMFALGGKDTIASVPIRQGESEALITLNLGTIIVRREITPNLTRLYVEAPDGARYPSPQKFIDALYGELTFDPAAFARMAPRVRLETLRKLVALDVDVDALDVMNERDYTRRADANRRIKSLAEREAIARERVEPGADVALIDLSPFLDELQTAAAFNTELARLRAAQQERTLYLEQKTQEYEDVVREINRLVERRDMLSGFIANEREAIATAPELVAPRDVAALRVQYQQAEAENRIRTQQARNREAHRAALEALETAREEAEAFTRAMDARTQQKAEAVARATMPIAGLAFGDGEVLYNGLPFDQASSAEQLRVSFAMAMAMNPKLRVVLIRDGSLMTPKTLALVASMAQEHDYQVWIERADPDARSGFLIEAGTLAAVDGVPVAPAGAAVVG